MIYVYSGKDPGLTKKILLKNLKGRELVTYDNYRDPISDVLSDCLALSLFGERKAVLFQNCLFLTNLKPPRGSLKEDENALKALLSYAEEPNPDTDLYLLAPAPLSATSAFVKALRKTDAIFQDCDPFSADDYLSYAYKRAKEEKKDITKEAAEELVERAGKDFLLFDSTLSLLFCYKDRIEKADVEAMVYKPLEDKAYECLSALLKGDGRKALATYGNLRKQGVEGLVVLLSFLSQLRLMAIVKLRSLQGQSNDEIAAAMGRIGSPMKGGRVYYMKKDLQGYTEGSLLRMLSDLGAIEEDCKLRGDDVDMRMALFLLDFPSYRKR